MCSKKTTLEKKCGWSWNNTIWKCSCNASLQVRFRFLQFPFFPYMPGFPARLPLLWCTMSPRRAPGLHKRCGLTEILNAWGKKSTRWNKIKSHKIPAKCINRKTSSFHLKHFSFETLFFKITNFWATQMLFMLCILSFNILFSFKKQNFNGK